MPKQNFPKSGVTVLGRVPHESRDVARSKYVGWIHMASAEREPITEVWGQSPQRGPGAVRLVRGSGGKVPLKLKTF